ncbi:Dihydrolipoyllysine-residue acetyltransferase component of pyruvate dehydrogenase complex [Rubripirellula tenax]|uniref:Dihydrolipoamide acetyltransferase component of pyruvate dehydrogenase complex n=1 Tax=Rubripirellula tenax TaxID=2528015 RepID=A0A5C6F3M2_9BACT|nr:2-oxo acid dehydrogenase subunit E2 [Rubripirellula tenax]TWU54646.1 Dihydrolipoyllysine-residue acetyltransferase component of pyruvate dehydrogenase complex [Rubripirellula tenax]
MTEVKLPELGDGIESGDVLEIFVSVGDVIKEGDDIVEMETDKATVAVPASHGGKVTKITVKEGETVPIGGVLIEVEAAAGSAAPPAAPSTPEPAKAEAPKPAPAPQPPKAEAPKPAPTPAPAQQAAPAPQAPPTPAPEHTEVVSASGAIPAGPAVRRFAREVGVDLANVQGSGDAGRISREDILAVVRATSQSAKAGAAAPKSAAPRTATPGLPGTAENDDFGPIRVERMSKIRKTISRQMHASWSQVPRVTNFDDADITDLERLRQSSKDDYAAQGLKLTTMPFLIKAVATALRHHPSMNAVIDEANEQIIYKDYVNIGIAVDTDRGLVVPVMSDTDRMGVPAITRSLAEMAGKVRGGNFGMNDLKGGSFTISNLGAIGGQYSTPIVNVPEVAILLVGRSRKLPVVMPDDSIKPRLMMPLSLSYDHRLVDGGTAARFLNDIIGYLEAPSRLLLAL